jgi:hypothetical protein
MKGVSDCSTMRLNDQLAPRYKLMLATKSMDDSTCPMIGFDIEKVAKFINLPEDHVMAPMVAIGKGTKDLLPKLGQL